MNGSDPRETKTASRNGKFAIHWAYAAFAFGLCLWIGHEFFGSMRDQLFLSDAGRQAETPRLWSAPLDDVFIHFDFARSAARGYPFQWSEGNGYSSGGTSLLYPLVIAAGYRFGYRGMELMHWAGIVATLSVWGCLMFGRSLFARLPAWSSWLLPLVLLSVGGLNWSLWSGMEVAFFLLVWSACVYLWHSHSNCADADRLQTIVRLGLANAVLVATRPEAAVTVACLAIGATLDTWQQRSWLQRLQTLLIASIPGALVLVAQAVANKHFTGEWSAAGALVKLEVNHPFLSRAEMWNAWVDNLRYQVVRITNFHLTDWTYVVGGVELSGGWIIWLFALLSLIYQATRRSSLLLWSCVLTWSAVVALNGQVRWQNERYAMPATAWLLMAAALGLAAVLRHGYVAFESHRKRLPAVAAGLSALAFIGYIALSRHQYMNQRWFFGRAARNIADQQATVGQLLRDNRAHRVLLGDAGAIPYVSDLPALDLVGLGGYHDLPFGRAMRLGVGAGIELLQHLPDEDLPDVMAIYPSWWSDLPVWFGERLDAVPAPGNVICGGYEKVIYRANFAPLIGTNAPAMRDRHELVRSELDFADLVSEKAAKLTLQNTKGFVTMRMLPHPRDPQRDLWDAGRILAPPGAMAFELTGAAPHEPARLVLRVAPAQESSIEWWLDGKLLRTQALTAHKGWQELSLELEPPQVSERMRVELKAAVGETILYHLWLTQARP